MIIKENTLREHAIAWASFLGAYAAVYGITLFMGRFVDASWDIRLLLWLNPDNYVRALDEFIILKTDFATYYVAMLLVAWQIGYYCSRNSKIAQARTRIVFFVLAGLFGIWHMLGLFIQNRSIFWWSEYEYPIVFIPLGIAFAIGFVVAGNLYVRLDDQDQRKLAQAFWLVLITVFFVNIIGEDIIKELVERRRPLHSAYEAWNDQIRILPDEVVRGSYSYISGHTSGFWAITTIYFWLFKSYKIKALVLLAGLLQGYTRIYTAAHFPYCVVMATFFAFPVASFIYFFLWNHRRLPLIAMLGLAVGLYTLTESFHVPGALLAIVIPWFLIHLYVSRNDAADDEPLAPVIEFSS